MNKLKSIFILTAFPILLLALSCGGSGGSSGGEAKVGSSCKGIGAMEGRMTCSENNVIFCSSMSKYNYKLFKKCPAGTKCVPTPGGKAAACK